MPSAEWPVRAGEPCAVDTRPTSEHERHQRDQIGGHRQAQEMLHAVLSVTSRDPCGQRHLEDKNLAPWGGCGYRRAKPSAVRRWWAPTGVVLGLLLLVGCREVRVKTLSTGTTTVLGGNQIIIVRDGATL